MLYNFKLWYKAVNTFWKDGENLSDTFFNTKKIDAIKKTERDGINEEQGPFYGIKLKFSDGSFIEFLYRSKEDRDKEYEPVFTAINSSQ